MLLAYIVLGIQCFVYTKKSLTSKWMPENFLPTLCEIGTSWGKGIKYSLHITLRYKKQIDHPYAV